MGRIPRSRSFLLFAGAAYAAVVFGVVNLAAGLSVALAVTLVIAAGVGAAELVYRTTAALAGAAAETERRSEQLAQIRQLSAGYSGALDPLEIATAFLQRVRRIIPASVTGTVVEYDAAAASFQVLASDGPRAGGFAAGSQEIALLPDPVRRRLITEHRTVTVPDIAADGDWSGVAERWPAMATVHSFAALPLVSRSRLIGLLFLQADQPAAFGAEELQLLPVLGQYVAGALHNALSLAEAEARADREAVVNRIGQRFRTSLDADLVIAITAEEAGRALGVSRALVCAGDTPQTLAVVNEWCADGVAPLPSGDRGAIPLAIAAAREARTVVAPEAGGGLAIPIRLGAQVFGVLLFQELGAPRAWTRGDVSLVESVASELRVALETARLFHTRQREAERMLALHRASALVAASTEPIQVLSEVLQAATGLLGRGVAALYRWDEEAGVLRLAEHMNAAPGTAPIVRVGEGVGGLAFARQEPVIVNDYQALPTAAPDNVSAGWRAALSVPLVRAGLKLGVLTVGATDPSASFDADDARLLSLFGDQAVAALTTASLIQQQQQAVAELERLNAAKSDFVSVVSHEFRTPLTGIRGFSELLRDDDLTTEEVREYAGAINADAQRLTRMINRMLDLDRLESGRVSVELGAVDLNAIIRSVVAGVRATTARHEIVLDLDPALGPVTGDRDQLTQVIVNLLSNAVKYSPEGGEIRIATCPEGPNAHVSVIDHGIGIPTSGLETVFERYTRLGSAATRFIQGTGLGLPIVRQIAIMHGGSVWADSTLGEGSTFHLTIPLAPRSGV